MQPPHSLMEDNLKQLTSDEYTALLEGAITSVTTQHEVQHVAEALVRRAGELGLVITIEQRPLPPLRQGNYSTEVVVRQKVRR